MPTGPVYLRPELLREITLILAREFRDSPASIVHRQILSLYVSPSEHKKGLVLGESAFCRSTLNFVKPISF